MTDEGAFERLATAILRASDQRYGSIVHLGVNAAGKTVKAPLDGVGFVAGADPPHLVAVHHTISARHDLRRKWLHDPSKVKARKKAVGPTAPAGDLIKTAAIVAEERQRTSDLNSTLVLTTNEEPDESVVRDVEAAGQTFGINIDLWSRSRLAHFLDNTPTGQWLRRDYLGIEEELLSRELLQQLSKRSLEVNRHDDVPSWVSRTLDVTLANSFRRDVTFLVAGSGLGKSVACYRALTAHVEAGGFGLIIPHEAVATAATLDQAIDLELRRLQPSLARLGPSALTFCSHERPMLLVVEDINRSGAPQHLAEKIAGWSRARSADHQGHDLKWRLVCPIWPETVFALRGDAQKHIEPLTVFGTCFTDDEGCAAVLARAKAGNRLLSVMSAQTISRALGHDPLLIALHDLEKAPDSHEVIGGFVDTSLLRTAAAGREHSASDFREALRALAGEMLTRRQLEISWRDIRGWASIQGATVSLINQLAGQGDLIRLTGTSADQRLVFRHDRVRDWILTDAAAELQRLDILPDDIVAEPYFAEVMGTVLAWNSVEQRFLERVAQRNPLALFHALRTFGDSNKSQHHAVLQAINQWLDAWATHDRSNTYLRWEALAMLAETDSHVVPSLVRRFQDQTDSGQLARLRNGDVSGGIELCFHIEPGVTAPWRDIQIEHAKLRHGAALGRSLDAFLRNMNTHPWLIPAALRLAGHLADPKLASAIEVCWNADGQRSNHLADYLWAAAECCGDQPARFLAPICDTWAVLPDQSDEEGGRSPRDGLAADHVRWAFRRWPPVSALDYFIQRAAMADLKWPIVDMLHGVDHPKAVSLVVREFAGMRALADGREGFFPYHHLVKDEWRRAQEDGRPMSSASRDLLLQLWRDKGSNRHLRLEAFSLWAATQYDGDLDILREAGQSEELAACILGQRLLRRDRQAIPAIIHKVLIEGKGRWWHFGRYVWSSELTEALDKFLQTRGEIVTREWGGSFEADDATSEMIMRLPAIEAERLLLKHWDHLRFQSYFVLAALYVSTPPLLAAVEAAIRECPQPAMLMQYLCSRYGIGMRGGPPGLTHESQVVALKPYLHLLSDLDVSRLRDECNERGWIITSQNVLDAGQRTLLIDQMGGHDQAMSRLDEMVENKLPYIDNWIDQLLKARIEWNEIAAFLGKWLEARRSINALQLVASAFVQKGSRDDLRLLKIYNGMPANLAAQIISNAQFRTRRRTLR